MLRAQRGPSRAAIAVIGAGVGLAAMVFGLADAYVSKPLPYTDPEELVTIGVNLLSGPPDEWIKVTEADLPSLASWRARTDLFEGFAAFEDRGWLMVHLSDRTVPLRAVAVTDDLLEVLGLESRWAEFDASAVWVSTRAAAMLSGSDLRPGQPLRLQPEGALRIRGVLPRSFLLPEADRTLPVDALVVLPAGPVFRKDGASTTVPGWVARKRPDVTADAIAAALSATMPAGRRVFVSPLSTAMTWRLRGLATGALLVSGLIVFVAWTNVFSIALTRQLYREREFATRTALGATPRRLAGLLLTENARIAALGSAIALVVTWLGISAAVQVLPPQFATLGVPSVTLRVVLAVVLAGAGAGVSMSIGSILAWQLNAGRRRASLIAGQDGRVIRLARFAVLTGQLCGASVLLAGAALLGHSFLNLLGVEVGMALRTETVTVAPTLNAPPSSRQEVVERTLLALRGTPGVQAAGASGSSLLEQFMGRGPLAMAGPNVFVPDRNGRPVMVDWTRVGGDYFSALGLQFVAGGPPSRGQSSAAVITERTAQLYFGGRMPVGEVLFKGETALPIVGVVRDVRVRALTLAPGPGVYEVGPRVFETQTVVTYVVRVADAHTSVGWEAIVQRVDPTAVILDSGTVGQRLGRSVRDRTFALLVIGLLALASVLVTGFGLAGVVAYTVLKRTREIALRLVLGAGRVDVTRLVVRDALAAGATGATSGIIASVWLSRYLESLLFNVSPADPATLLLTAACLLVVVFGAALLPALGAAHIAPAIALQAD